MNRETKVCQKCKKDFWIEPEDFKFYQKISVPPPTWCPEGRMVRRMNFRNERALYRNKCVLCSKDTLSAYPEKSDFVIYCHNCWWSDKWSTLDYGIEYNFSKSFFEQFKDLMKKVPRPALSYTNAVASEYINYGVNMKNTYLTFGSHDLENVSYAKTSAHSKDSIDITTTLWSEFCYETVDCSKCFKVFFSRYVEDSQEDQFLFACRNCSDCLGCANLRSKSHCIFNQQYLKDEYDKKIKEFDLGSYKNFIEFREKFKEHVLKYPHRFAMIRNSINVIGDDIRNSKNCYWCFFVTRDAENCRYSANISDATKDSMDLTGAGLDSELLYEEVSGIGRRSYFGVKIWYSYDIILSEDCHNSSNLFACIGLHSKSYCILNRQYTKEEYEALVPKIIEHMNTMPYIDKKGRVYKYGEFFPPELSPFSYNETIAQEYFPLTREEAIEQGYSWKDPEPRNYQITLKTEDIPDHIKDVPDSILNEIIQCAHHQLGGETSNCNEQCTEAFRIIPQELDFLRKMNLPLPRLCPNCRHYQRIKQRNPLKLWHRKCMCGTKTTYTNTIKHDHEGQCPIEFETTYAPERPEIVYCEKCYLKEVV